MIFRGSLIALGLILAPTGAAAQNIRAPVIVDCQPGPYVVFFGAGSARVGKEGRSVLRRMPGILATCGRASIRLDGYGDRGERSAIAAARAKAVRRALVRLGIASERIVIGRGFWWPSPPRVRREAAGLPDRRVEIRFGSLE